MKKIVGKTKAGIILITLLLMGTLVSATSQQADDELVNAIEENSISSQAVDLEAIQVGGVWDEKCYPSELPPQRSGWTFVVRRFAKDIFNDIWIYCKGCALVLMRRCDGENHSMHFEGYIKVKWTKHQNFTRINLTDMVPHQNWSHSTFKGFDFITLYTWYPFHNFYYAELHGTAYYDYGDPQDIVVKPMKGYYYYSDGHDNSAPIEKAEDSDLSEKESE